MVFRVYVEKKKGLAPEAASLLADIRSFLGLAALEDVRILNRYDVEDIDADLFHYAKTTVFSEPQLDVVSDTADTEGAAAVFAAADWLPGMLRGAWAFLGLLAPFGWGLLLAYVLDIPTRFFAQKLFGGRRGGAMAVSYALFFGALALLAALVVPQLVQSVTTFAGRLGAYEETIRGLLVWVQNTFGIDTATAEQLVQMVGTALQNWFGGLSSSAARAAADFVSGAAGAAGNAVVALAASIYLLSGKEALLRAARACLHAALPPRAAGSVLEICRLANKIFSGYIGGQLVDALLVGGETFALMSIFGLEYAPLLAVLVGVTNIVPVLGPFLGAVPGLIILLLELPWKAAEFAIIIFVI